MAAVTFSINAIDKTRAAFATVKNNLRQAERQAESIGKKFTILGTGKDLLTGLGLGGGFAVAQSAAAKIADYWRESAESAQRIADLSDQTTRTFLQRMRARRNDEEQISLLRKREATLTKQLEEISAPKFIQRPVASGALGIRSGTESVLVKKTDQEREAMAALRLELEQVTLELEDFDRSKKKVAEGKQIDLQKIADRITEANRTPVEVFNQSVRTLRSVKDLLSPETFTREFERLRNTLLNPTASTGLGAPSKPLTDQFTRIGFLNDRGTSANEAMQSEAKKQTNLLQTIADTLKKGMAAPRREIYGGAAILT